MKFLHEPKPKGGFNIKDGVKDYMKGVEVITPSAYKGEMDLSDRTERCCIECKFKHLNQ